MGNEGVKLDQDQQPAEKVLEDHLNKLKLETIDLDNIEPRSRQNSKIGHLKATVLEGSSRTLDNFELLKVLGEGAQGKVYQVRYKKNGKIYAMKIIKKSKVIEKNTVESTRAERRILEQIDHPFIVSLRYAFQNPDKLFLIFDYFSGGELLHHLSGTIGFGEQRTKFYAAEILLALEHLHSLNIIYRDLKPENVLVDEFGHLVLTDFGLAKENIQDGETTTSIVGTPDYLAPEVLQRIPYSKPVDI